MWPYAQEKFKKMFLPATIILVATLSFGLGRLSKIEENKIPLVVEQEQQSGGEVLGATAQTGVGATLEKFVASKSGAKYHFPWCSGAKRISEVNKVWFQSKEEAERAGYSPAANCPGL